MPQQVTAVASTTATKYLDRSNDGVVFHHLQTTRIMTDVWNHTTLFVLPSHKNWLRRSSDYSKQFPNHNVTDRDQLSFLFHRFPQVIEALNVIYSHTGVYLHTMEQEIRDIIPTTLDLSDDYRKRRGLGSWIGSGLSSMFGLVKIKSSKLTLKTSEAGIPALCKLPDGVGSRYTGRTVCQRHASDAGIPGLFSNAYWHLNARVIEIQTRQQLKNVFHETQRIVETSFAFGQQAANVRVRFFKVTCLCCIFESTSAIFVLASIAKFCDGRL